MARLVDYGNSRIRIKAMVESKLTISESMNSSAFGRSRVIYSLDDKVGCLDHLDYYPLFVLFANSKRLIFAPLCLAM